MFRTLWYIITCPIILLKYHCLSGKILYIMNNSYLDGERESVCMNASLFTSEDLLCRSIRGEDHHTPSWTESIARGCHSFLMNLYLPYNMKERKNIILMYWKIIHILNWIFCIHSFLDEKSNKIVICLQIILLTNNKLIKFL